MRQMPDFTPRQDRIPVLNRGLGKCSFCVDGQTKLGRYPDGSSLKEPSPHSKASFERCLLSLNCFTLLAKTLPFVLVVGSWLVKPTLQLMNLQISEHFHQLS